MTVFHFSSNPTNDNNYFNEDNDGIDNDINILVEELDKPFDIAEIVSTIQSLLRNKAVGSIILYLISLLIRVILLHPSLFRF